MREFQRAARTAFAAEMVEHLRNYSPVYAPVLGEPGLQNTVELGLARTADYGLTERGAVRLFLELMLLLGRDFDSDPQLPWARRILADRTEDDLMRADQMYVAVQVYLDAVGGPQLEYYFNAARRAAQTRFEDLPPLGPDMDARLLAFLKAAYPQKYEYAGEDAMAELVGEARRFCAVQKWPDAGVPVTAAMMFAFGKGAMGDPRFPHLAEALREIGGAKPAWSPIPLFDGMQLCLKTVV